MVCFFDFNFFGNFFFIKWIFVNNWFRSGVGFVQVNIILCNDAELIFSIRNKFGDGVYCGGYLSFVVFDLFVS